MPAQNAQFGLCRLVTYLLIVVALVLSVVFFLFNLIICFWIGLASALLLMIFDIVCPDSNFMRRTCDKVLAFTWAYMTGPIRVVVPYILDELQSVRWLWEIASDLFRLYGRRHTQAEGTRDNIATGHPENVGSAPEYDVASSSSISNQDDEQRSQTIRRCIDSEPTRPLNPAYPMITWPRPAQNEQHRNPSRPNLQSSIPRTLAPASGMEENIEERNRNRMSNESEYSSPDGISTSPTPLPGPSGLQRRRGQESNEAEVHPHSQPISCELYEEPQLHNPAIQSETLPATHQVIGENLPDQVAQTEESAAVSLTMHQRTSLEDSCQAEHETAEESST